MNFKKISPVVIFAVSFAFMEAAVVVYLRRLLSVSMGLPQINKKEILVLAPGVAFLDPKAALAIIKDSRLLRIEQFREAATIVILASVAFLAGRERLQKIAYFLLAFGIWDIFYYVFLRLTIGWPKSLADPDVLFLLPVPWVGPVVTPLVVSALMILAGLFLLNKGLRNTKRINFLKFIRTRG